MTMSRSPLPPQLRALRLSQRKAHLPWAFAAGTIGCEIAYPLFHGTQRSALAVAAVLLFFLASAVHAAVHRGLMWAGAYVVLAAGIGLAAEAIGVSTGRPFGRYGYADDLGPKVFDVPALVPLAWAMVAYPALLVGRRLGGRGPRAWVVGALALASWDLFLDPEMVARGHWRWQQHTPALPGIPSIPLTNWLGWVVISLFLIGVLHVVLPHRRADDAVPSTLYLWTYASSVLASAVFFHRPVVAAYVAVVMGLVALPFAVSLWRDRP